MGNIFSACKRQAKARKKNKALLVSNAVHPIKVEESKTWLSRSGNVGAPMVPIQAWTASPILERANVMTSLKRSLGLKSVTKVDEIHDTNVVQRISIKQLEENQLQQSVQDLEILDLTEEINTCEQNEENSPAQAAHDITPPIDSLYKQEELPFLSSDLPMPFVNALDRKDGHETKSVPAVMVYDDGLDEPNNDVLQVGRMSYPPRDVSGTTEIDANGTALISPELSDVDSWSSDSMEVMDYFDEWLSLQNIRYSNLFSGYYGTLSPIKEEEGEEEEAEEDVESFYSKSRSL